MKWATLLLFLITVAASQLVQTELQQEHEFNSGNSENSFTEETGRTGGNSATSVVTGEEITSWCCPTSVVFGENVLSVFSHC